MRCGPVGHHVNQLWRSCESKQINPTAIRTERVRQQRVADAENASDRYAGVATAANAIRDALLRANGNSDVRAAVQNKNWAVQMAGMHHRQWSERRARGL